MKRVPPDLQGNAPPGPSPGVDGREVGRGGRIAPAGLERLVAALLGAALALHGTKLLAACPFESRRPGYLAVVGAPPVRFQDESSPVPHPAQPVPAASDTPEVPAPTAAPAPMPAAPAAPAAEPPKPQVAPAAPEEKPPAGLLWDAAPPKVRPEDLLPYFQSPGTSERPEGTTFVLPPEPPLRSTSDLPISSATYTQSNH